MATKSNLNNKVSEEKSSHSESGMAANYSIEVIGLLGLATLIYATFALFFIS
jgi:hypothetical protein